jgi:hypothetical protein
MHKGKDYLLCVSYILRYTVKERLTFAGTLTEIYIRVASRLADVKDRSEDNVKRSLRTLVQVLQEGPDYLIDVAIIEAIIWQAEVIDPQFGGEIRGVLDRAIAEQDDLAS